MTRILIVYSSTNGHTKKICFRLRQLIEDKDKDKELTLLSVSDANSIDLDLFDKIIIGASIRYGKHHKEIFKFIEKNRNILERKSNAFFSVNMVARKPEKNTPETNPYLLKFLNQTSWNPNNIAVFAGKIEYKKYKLFDRLIIKLIMYITKGPTDPNTNIEYTNWSQVEEFGEIICSM